MSDLLRAVIVARERGGRESLRAALAGTGAASVVAEYDDVAAAVREAPARRPDVVVVVVAAPRAGRADADPVESVRQLVEALPEAAVVATGGGVPAETGLKLIRAGALEFLAGPVQAVDLGAALGKLARMRHGTRAGRAPGRITSVFSTKGGVGVTTVAINLAVCLAERKPDRTLLVELDSRHSDIATFLDLRPAYSVLDAFQNVERLDESFLRGLLTKAPGGLWVLPGPAGMERMRVDAAQTRAVLAALRTLFDEVVIDLRDDLDPATLAALEVSDVVLFLTSLTVSTLRSAAAGLAAFRHVGLDLGKVRVVLMRADTGEDVTPAHAQQVLGLPVFWKTPSDYATVVASINDGKPVVTAAPRSRVGRNLRQLAEQLSLRVGAGAPAPARVASLLGRVLNPKRA